MSKSQKKDVKEKNNTNDDRISLDYKMDLKPGYSSFKLFPENKESPDHVNQKITKNYLLTTLLEPPRKPYKFAERIHKFKERYENVKLFEKMPIQNYYKPDSLLIPLKRLDILLNKRCKLCSKNLLLYEKKDKHFRIKICNSLVEYLPQFIISKIEKIKSGVKIINRLTINMINLFSPGKLELHLKDTKSVYIKEPRNTKGGCIIQFQRSGTMNVGEMQKLVLHFAENELMENVMLSIPTEVVFELSNREQKVGFDLLFDLGIIETLFVPLQTDAHR